MIELENINNNLDLSTKLGREVFDFSREMQQKIILHERTIEEYKNIKHLFILIYF